MGKQYFERYFSNSWLSKIKWTSFSPLMALGYWQISHKIASLQKSKSAARNGWVWTESFPSISPHPLQDFCCCERWIVRWGNFLHVWESLMTKNLFSSCFQCCGTAIFLLYLRESPHPERSTWNILQYDKCGSSTKRFPNFATYVRSPVTSLK